MRRPLVICICLSSLLLSFFCVGYGAAKQGIRGRAIDRNGEALVGVDVLITNYQGRLYNWTVSDKRGFFQFNDIAPGPYNIIVASKGEVKSDKFYAYLDNPVQIELKMTGNQFSIDGWTRQIGMAVVTALLATFFSYMLWRFQLGRHRRKALRLIVNHFKPILAESWREIVENLTMIDQRKDYFNRVHAAYAQTSKLIIDSLEIVVHRLETWLKQYEGVLAEADPELVDILIDCRSLTKEQWIRDSLADANWLRDITERQKIMSWKDKVDEVLDRLIS